MTGTRVVTGGRDRRLVGYLAILTGAIGLVALVGWFGHIPALIQIAPSYPAVRVNAALGFLGAALGLWGLARDRPGLVIAGALGAMLIGGLTLVEHMTGADLAIDNLLVPNPGSIVSDSGLVPRGSGRMATAAALNLFLTGLALLALGTNKKQRLAKTLAGTIGTVVLGIAAAALFSYATGVLSATLRVGPLTSFAIHGSVAYILIGVALIIYSWRHDNAPTLLPTWTPWAVAGAVLVTTGFVWRALTDEGDRYAADRLDSEAKALAQQVAFRFDNVTRILRRISARHVDESGRDTTEWQVTLARVFSDVDGLAAVVWLDSTRAIRRVDPAPVQTDTSLVPLIAKIRPTAAIGIPSPMTAPAQAFLGDERGRPSILWAIPICGTRCIGYTAALLRLEPLLGTTVAELSAGYATTLTVGTRPLYRTAAAKPGGENGPSAREPIDLAGIAGAVEVRALPGTIEAARSDLPTVVAGLGILVSVLLAATLRMAQGSANAARRSERERLSHALESTDDGLWEIDLVTGDGTRSAAVWRRLGYQVAEMPPREQERLWASLVHPDDHPGLNAALEAHLAGTSPSFEAEYRVKASDGSSHWIIDRGRVVEYGGHQRPLRMLGVCADVTERKLADQSLLASEQRFRTMFDSGFQIKTLLDIDCCVLEANRTALDFIAGELAQIRGVKVWETPWWSSSGAVAGQIKDACSKVSLGDTVRFETEICGVDGRRAIVDFSLKPICDAEGRVIQMLAECRDITDWQRSEDNLREMATLSTMGRLAAKVAHEINNPLAGIQNAFLLLKDAIPTTHPYYRYVGAIERETARIGAVTRQLYETYRPESDDTEVSSVPTAISDSVALLEQVNRSTGVTITIDAQRAPPVLAIPSSMLRQVIYNLVQNAIEASPPGGKVAVRAWAEPEAFWLTVSDQGPGITPELRERVFDEFGASKNTLRTAGMGLGLALVRRAVESVAGKVSVSDAEGGGAEFRVMIPIGPRSPSGVVQPALGFRTPRLGL